MKTLKSGFARAKVPCYKNHDIFHHGFTLKNKRMTLSRTLRRMYEQRLTEAYRHSLSPGLFELTLLVIGTKRPLFDHFFTE